MGNRLSVDNKEVSSWIVCDEEKTWILKIRVLMMRRAYGTLV